MSNTVIKLAVYFCALFLVSWTAQLLYLRRSCLLNQSLITSMSHYYHTDKNFKATIENLATRHQFSDDESRLHSEAIQNHWRSKPTPAVLVRPWSKFFTPFSNLDSAFTTGKIFLRTDLVQALLWEFEFQSDTIIHAFHLPFIVDGNRSCQHLTFHVYLCLEDCNHLDLDSNAIRHRYPDNIFRNPQLGSPWSHVLRYPNELRINATIIEQSQFNQAHASQQLCLSSTSLNIPLFFPGDFKLVIAFILNDDKNQNISLLISPNDPLISSNLKKVVTHHKIFLQSRNSPELNKYVLEDSKLLAHIQAELPIES